MISLKRVITGQPQINEAKPSAGLTKKEKSKIVKKAKKGKDIGSKGKKFKEVEKAAEKEYKNPEISKKIAASVMWKKAAKAKK
jgi:hypothetical protein